ncbi:MAG: SAM-dependent chlorinase/fluorinase [Candidatus Omnitrophica bacterium]|nr:SAM-dependent chlorinase/fluorinase [Candidatus Omnitrophota bacterium]
MNTIALITDFGLKDNFAGVIKGVCLKINPEASLIDISHGVLPQNILEASFLLLKSFSFFPGGTVFLVVVDPGVGSQRRALAVKTRNFYFVGPDNGVLWQSAAKDGIKKIISLTNKKYFLKEPSSTFHGRDIFAPCASYLSKGMDINKLGNSLNKIKSLCLPMASLENNRLSGEILYIDKFGNLVTNITKSQFLKFTKRRRFRLHIKSRVVNKIYSFYNQALSNNLFLCEGSFGFLEISLREKSAAALLRAKLKDKIIVKV